MQGIQRITGVVTLTGPQYVYDLNAQERHLIAAVLTPEDLKGYEEERAQMIKLFTSHFYQQRKKISELQDINIKHLGENRLVTFRWRQDDSMPIWDSAGRKLTKPAAINGGAKVKLAFQQVAWGNRLADEGRVRQRQSPQHGTTLKLRGIQLIAESQRCTDQWHEQDICNMFGEHPGGFIENRDIGGLNAHRPFERPRKLRS